ncbi:MAG: cytoskeleton protein RodZ [Gammaproteobacteria bacterium]|nr:MAG: cytoskeleton protein RodZ [Gammaproteobacteria bacterium]
MGEPGASLVQAREAAGLTRQQAAEKLHLSVQQVGALDENRFEDLPGATYVKGYIRNYASLLNIPSDDLIAAYEECCGEPEVPELSSLAQPQQMTSGDQTMKLATLAVVAVVIGLALTWWLNREQPVVSPQQLSEAAIETDSVQEKYPNIDYPEAVQDLRAELNQDTTESSRSSTAPATGNDDAIVDSGEQPGTEAAMVDNIQDKAAIDNTEAAPSGQEPRLVLEVSDDSWVDIRDSHNRRLLYETVASGRTVTLSGAPPFNVFLGNAQGVRLSYKGKDFDITPHRRGLVARFTLGEAGE